METALFLGITSGGACLTTCGPLAAAFLAAERVTLKQSAALLTAFLSGRLLGYIGWAAASWLLGWAILQGPAGLNVFAAVDLVLGGWLIYYGLSQPHEICAGPILKAFPAQGLIARPSFRSAAWGFLTGVQVCPPFLAAFAGAARTGSLWGSVLFFLIFYSGTALWFIPFPLIGALGRFRQVAQVARFCALPLGAYYALSGFITLTGGSLFHG